MDILAWFGIVFAVPAFVLLFVMIAAAIEGVD